MNVCSVQIQQLHIKRVLPDDKELDVKSFLTGLQKVLEKNGYTVEGPILHFDSIMSFPGMKYDENGKIVPETKSDAKE